MNALCQFSIHARIDFDQDSGKRGNRVASVALALGEHSLRLGAMKFRSETKPAPGQPRERAVSFERVHRRRPPILDCK